MFALHGSQLGYEYYLITYYIYLKVVVETVETVAAVAAIAAVAAVETVAVCRDSSSMYLPISFSIIKDHMS